MQYAQNNPTGTSTSVSASAFQYSDHYVVGADGKTYASVSSICATYAEPFISITRGIQYGAGEYFLAENLQTTPIYSVWQFYVQDASGAPVVYNPRVTYFDQPNAVVPDNGTVIWRLVNLLTGPNPAPKQAKARLA
jgi:hypothetical protein